jgi:MFS family permease
MSIRLVLALALCNMTSLRAGRVLFALYALSLDATPITVGVLAALFALFPGVMSWPVGMVADRFGSRWLLIIGTTGTGIAMLVPYFYPGMGGLFAAASILGFSFALYNVSLQNLIGLISTTNNRTQNFSNFGLAQSIASFFGPMAVGFGIDHVGYGSTCMYFALISILPVSMLALWGHALPPGTRKANDGGSVLHTLKDAGLWRILATGSLVVEGIELYQFYMPVYGHAIGISASAIGVIVAMFAAASFVVRLVMPLILARLSEKKILAYSFYLGALGFILLPFFQGVVALSLISFLIGLGLGCGQPITMTLAFSNSVAGRSGEIMGLRVTINNLTRVVVPIIFGSIGTLFGMFAVFGVSALMLGSGGVLTREKKKNAANVEDRLP